MSGRGGSRWALAVVAAGLAVWLAARGGGHLGPAGPAASPPRATASGAASAGGADDTPSPSASDAYDPAHFATQVRTRATAAGIDPQLLMAILYNESYKPHDPAFERAWQQLKPDSAFGIANMHRAAFDDTKRGRDFADRDWDELPGDPDLAIEAAAWYLHDLGAQLPAHWSAGYTRDDLLALGYNTGAGNMLIFARGTSLGPAAQSYLNQLHGNWTKAAAALAG
ncbi:transglycosylase SLT domain-containing protein [Kitasatospora sp. NPDC052896]|uniref:transglycosylase SLT domain-containing protein n=1 Tax=Kitasatospora sp. NPDC052896 TaxID=3364061 RepID=UPI0037C5E4D8